MYILTKARDRAIERATREDNVSCLSGLQFNRPKELSVVAYRHGMRISQVGMAIKAGALRVLEFFDGQGLDLAYTGVRGSDNFSRPISLSLYVTQPGLVCFFGLHLENGLQDLYADKTISGLGSGFWQTPQCVQYRIVDDPALPDMRVTVVLIQAEYRDFLVGFKSVWQHCKEAGESAGGDQLLLLAAHYLVVARLECNENMRAYYCLKANECYQEAKVQLERSDYLKINRVLLTLAQGQSELVTEVVSSRPTVLEKISPEYWRDRIAAQVDDLIIPVKRILGSLEAASEEVVVCEARPVR